MPLFYLIIVPKHQSSDAGNFDMPKKSCEVYIRIGKDIVQLTLEQFKQYFQSTVGDPQMWRAKCVHYSVPFYIRDLSILVFVGVLE